MLTLPDGTKVTFSDVSNIKLTDFNPLIRLVTPALTALTSLWNRMTQAVTKAWMAPQCDGCCG